MLPNRGAPHGCWEEQRAAAQFDWAAFIAQKRAWAAKAASGHRRESRGGGRKEGGEDSDGKPTDEAESSIAFPQLV